MYKKGDLVVYGNTGVCKVKDVSYGPDGELYYVLDPMYEECTIYAPVKGKVFIRSIMTQDEALGLIDSIPGIKAEPYYNNRIQELSSHYKSIIDTHDCAELVSMLRSLHEKKIAAEKMNRKLGQVDERFMKRAEELLHGELAAVLGIEKDHVAGFIHRRIGHEFL